MDKDSVKNLVDSVNELRKENSISHRDINKKIDSITMAVSKIDKESSIINTELNNHLEQHKKKEHKATVNGVAITSLVGNLLAAIIGAVSVLLVSGIT